MNATRILKMLSYLPRWAWYLASLSIGGPIGPLFVYLAFHALDKRAKEEEEEAQQDAWRQRTHAPRSEAASQNYRDEECVVTGEEDDGEIRRQWARTEASARRAQENAYAQDEEEEDALCGDVADVKRQLHRAVSDIRKANDGIPDPELSAQLDSIENSCRQILSALEQRPQLLGELRTFLRYYLPTTLKLLDARVKLEKNAGTAKAREVRARINEALGVVDKAFLKQVEAIDEYRFIDLESEMDVLRDMLRADGLTGEDDEGFSLGTH